MPETFSPVFETPAQQPLRSPELQALKFVLHRKLLDRINLETLAAVGEERGRTEIRRAVTRLVEEEGVPLTLEQKDQAIEEALHEVFGVHHAGVLFSNRKRNKRHKEPSS